MSHPAYTPDEMRQRILARLVILPSGCWMLQSRQQDRPLTTWNGKRWVMYRLMWTLFKGPIPTGLFVLHKCDYGMCVNFDDHLFLGTQLDNMRDMIAKGRKVITRPSAKLTIEQVRYIKQAHGWLRNADLARKFNVVSSVISRIWTGERWRDV